MSDYQPPINVSEEDQERERAPRDVSREFLSMRYSQFEDFVRKECQNDKAISICFDWVDVSMAIRAKAFLEDSSIEKEKFATIRATQEQHDQEMNVFASGVKWEKVE